MSPDAAEVKRWLEKADHDQFVSGYRRGTLKPVVALKIANTFTWADRWKHRAYGENLAQLLLAWINYLCFPVALGLFIWSSWWIAVLVFTAGVLLWDVNRRWMVRLVLQCALDDAEFYALAVEAGAIILPKEPEQATAPHLLDCRDSLRGLLDALRHSLEGLYQTRLVRIILYGSCARGQATEGSDIDVLVVLEGPVDPAEEIARVGPISAALSLEANVVLSCHFVSAERFASEQSPLLINVRREGVPI